MKQVPYSGTKSIRRHRKKVCGSGDLASLVGWCVFGVCVCVCGVCVWCVCGVVCVYVCMYVMYLCMYVCMYVCVYICVCVYVCMLCVYVCYVFVYVCIYLCMYVYMCMYVCVYYVCMFYVCMYSCMYVCIMYVCMYVRMCIYARTHTQTIYMQPNSSYRKVRYFQNKAQETHHERVSMFSKRYGGGHKICRKSQSKTYLYCTGNSFAVSANSARNNYPKLCLK